jgi:hypothetical protein
MKNSILSIVVIVLLLNISCDKIEDTKKNDCVRGKYIGSYCEGIAIEIIDNSKIGKNWTGTYDNKLYSNSIVVSLDSTLLINTQNLDSYFSKDSTFYFKYKEGGYPRKQYNVCDPSASITIISLSKNPCNENK